ncbi:hypothetical protein C9374_013853 [Naegleria lovaniensis]|uniref:Uncharacterized protein n=1 Tax=Naegleria lovaniensis TaxID=51637 RepID=A0AA88H1G6_NAELO|nr:uncharacterized protein C9374_013853 [Naegleria lovaniensis]KAG2389293.1 hypothetical protein C9374_013853 [Naegleria lovaniensis]
MIPLYHYHTAHAPLSSRSEMNHVGPSPSTHTTTAAMANMATMIINNFYHQCLAGYTQAQHIQHINQLTNDVKIAYLCTNALTPLGNHDDEITSPLLGNEEQDHHQHLSQDESDHNDLNNNNNHNNNNEGILDTLNLSHSTLQFEEEPKPPRSSVLVPTSATSLAQSPLSSNVSLFDQFQQEKEEHTPLNTHPCIHKTTTSFECFHNGYKEKQLESLFDSDEEENTHLEEEASSHPLNSYSSSLFKYTSEVRRQHWLEEEQAFKNNFNQNRMVQPILHYSHQPTKSSTSSLSSASSSSSTSGTNTPTPVLPEDNNNRPNNMQQWNMQQPQPSLSLPQYSTNQQPSFMNTDNNPTMKLSLPQQQQPTFPPSQNPNSTFMQSNLLNQPPTSFAFPMYYQAQQQPLSTLLNTLTSSINTPQPSSSILRPQQAISSSDRTKPFASSQNEEAMNRNFYQKKLSHANKSPAIENNNQVQSGNNNKYTLSGFDQLQQQQQQNINPLQFMTATSTVDKNNPRTDAEWLLRNMNQQATNNIGMTQNISKNSETNRGIQDTNNSFSSLASKFWTENIGTGTGEQGNDAVTSGLTEIKELNTPTLENILRVFNTASSNGMDTVGNDQNAMPYTNSLFHTTANNNNNLNRINMQYNNLNEKMKVTIPKSNAADTSQVGSNTLMVDPTKPSSILSSEYHDETSSHSLSRSSSGSLASDAGRSSVSSSSTMSGHQLGRANRNGNEDRSWKVFYQDSAYRDDNSLIKRPSFMLKTRTDNIMDQIPPILYSSLKYQFNIAVFLSTEKATQLLMSHKENLESIMHASAMSLGGFIIATIETALVGEIEEMEDDDELMSLVRDEVNPTRKICNGVVNGDIQLALQPIEAIEATEAKAFKPFLHQLKQEIKEHEQADEQDAHKWSCVHNKTKIQFTDLPFHNKKSSFVMRVCFYLNHEFKERKPILVMESAPFKIFARRNKKSYFSGANTTGTAKEEDVSHLAKSTSTTSGISSVSTASSSKQGASNKRRREDTKKKSQKVKKPLEPEEEREVLVQYENELLSLMNTLDTIKDRVEHQAAVRSFIQTLVGPELAQQYMSHLRGKYPSIMQAPAASLPANIEMLPVGGTSAKKSKGPFPANLSVDTKSLGKVTPMHAARLITPASTTVLDTTQQPYLQQQAQPFMNPNLAFNPLVNIPNMANAPLFLTTGMPMNATEASALNMQPTYSDSIPVTTTSNVPPSSTQLSGVSTTTPKTTLPSSSQTSNDMLQSIGQQNVLDLMTPPYQSSLLFDFQRSPTGFGNISTPRFSSTTTYSPLGMVPSSNQGSSSTSGFFSPPTSTQPPQKTSSIQQPQGEPRDTSGIRPQNLIQMLQPQNKIDFNKLKTTSNSSDTSFINDYLSELLEDNANSNNMLSPINLLGTPTSANLGSDLPSFNFFERNSQSNNNNNTNNNNGTNNSHVQQQASGSEFQEDPLTPKTLAFLTQSKLV